MEAPPLTLSSLLAELETPDPARAEVEVEVVDLTDLSDRDRLLRIEARQAGFEELVKEQRAADRSQLVAIVTRADQFAVRSDVEKLEIRLEAVDRALTELREKVVPRSETESKLEAVTANIEAVKNEVRALSAVLGKLDTTLTTQASDRENATSRSDARRNGIIATITAAAAVIGVYFASHASTKTVYVPYSIPAATATTTTIVGRP